MSIVRALNIDHLILSDLTKKSKSYWGFSEKQLNLWDKELTISAEYIQQNVVFKLVKKEKIIGYYSLIIKDEEWILDNMFVLPAEIGKGHGSALMKHLLSYTSNKNVKRISLDAEPKAVNFYSKHGFHVISEYESSIKDRFLKVMIKTI